MRGFQCIICGWASSVAFIFAWLSSGFERLVLAYYYLDEAVHNLCVSVCMHRQRTTSNPGKMEVIAMATSSTHNASGSGYVFVRSDTELEEQVREAIEASNDNFAFHIQLQEILPFSDFTFAYNLQLVDINTSLPASSSFSEQEMLDEYEFLPNNQDYQGRAEKALGSWQCSYRRQGSVSNELCGICFEDSLPEMFEGMHCLHRFCHSCMTQ